MWRRSDRSQAGITLVEALLTAAIFALLTGLVLSIMLGSRQVEEKQQAAGDVFQAVAVAQETIRRDIKLGRLLEPADGAPPAAQIRFQRPCPGLNGDPAMDGSGQIIWDDSTDHTYRMTDGWLERSVEPTGLPSPCDPLPASLRRVVYLGPGGSVTFSREGNLLTVRASARAAAGGRLPDSLHTVGAQYVLEHQP